MSTMCHNQFFGSTTVGEKGQIVIPAEARKLLNLEKGEKLLVFGLNGDTLALAKLSQLEEFAAHLAKKSTDLKNIINESIC